MPILDFDGGRDTTLDCGNGGVHPHTGCFGTCGLHAISWMGRPSLQLDFDVDAGGELEAHKRVDGL
jgi:hypothetical protein